MPGIRRVGSSNRVRYVDASGRTIFGSCRAAAHPLAGDPAGLDGCLDLSEPARPSSGHGSRRARPQTIPLSSALARGARRSEIRTADRVRRGAAAHSHAHERRPALNGLPREKVLGGRRAAAREDAHPRRQRGIRAGQRILRPDDDARPAREDRGRRRCASNSAARAASARVDLHDRRLARIVKACRELPGYELFQYVDDDGKRQVIDSAT